MGVVDIEAKVLLTRQRLNLAAKELDSVNPMFREQVKAVLLPVILSVESLAAAVEGVHREL